MTIKKLITGAAAITMLSAASSAYAAGNYDNFGKPYAQDYKSDAGFDASTNFSASNFMSTNKNLPIDQIAPTGAYFGLMGNFSITEVYAEKASNALGAMSIAQRTEGAHGAPARSGAVSGLFLSKQYDQAGLFSNLKSSKGTGPLKNKAFDFNPFGLSLVGGYAWAIGESIVAGLEAGIDVPIFGKTHEKSKDASYATSHPYIDLSPGSMSLSLDTTKDTPSTTTNFTKNFSVFGQATIGFGIPNSKIVVYGLAGYGMTKFSLNVSEMVSGKIVSSTISKTLGSARFGGGGTYKLNSNLTLRAEYAYALQNNSSWGIKQTLKAPGVSVSKSGLKLGVAEHIIRAGIVFNL